MPPRRPRNADCYASGERTAMQWTQQVRQYLLAPLLGRLAACRVKPDHLTLLGLAAGLAFCPLYFFCPLAAFVALGLHVLLDGMDGPLARWTHTASRRGSFTDSLADQTVIVATTVPLMVAGTIGPAAGGCYIFLYTVVVLFAMARNAMSVPYSWLVRPRLLVYAWLAVELYLLPGSLDWVLWLFNAILGVKMLSGFLRIRRRI